LVGFGVDVTKSTAVVAGFGTVIGVVVGTDVFGVAGDAVDEAATSGGTFRFQMGNFLPGSVSFSSDF